MMVVYEMVREHPVERLHGQYLQIAERDGEPADTVSLLMEQSVSTHSLDGLHC